MPNGEIVDGAHGSTATLSNPHFFFLPPAVPQPSFSGDFDASLAPEVIVCEYSDALGCSRTVVTYSTIAHDASAYSVNWRTKDFDVSAGSTYRIAVLVAGTELGHADVVLRDVSTEAVSMKNAKTGDDIALVDGQTLPIRFRIERGAVASIGAGGGALIVRGLLTIDVPASALAVTVGVTAVPTTVYPAGRDLASDAYELGPDGTTFARPATLTMHFDPTRLLKGVGPELLSLYTVVRDTDGVMTWQRVPHATVDAAAQTVSAPIDHFSTWSVLLPHFTVHVDSAIGSIYAPQTAYGQAHSTMQLTASVTIDNGGTNAPAVNWSTSDASIATVSATGLVTGVAPGPVTISAGAGSSSDSTMMWVLAPAASVTLTPSTSSLTVGAPLNSRAPLSMIARDVNGNVVSTGADSWTSSSSTIATVDGGGTVRSGTQPGTATITATVQGVSGTAAVTVWPAPVPNYDLPETVQPSARTFSGGANHTCGIDVSGAAWCWGLNIYGSVGNGTSSAVGSPHIPSPARVSGGLTFASISAGLFHTCGLTTDGTAYCWGYNVDGELGIGNTTGPKVTSNNGFAYADVPVPVATNVKFVAISAGYFNSCALTAGGTVFCWGKNEFGELGIGSTGGLSATPVAVPTTETFAAVGVGQNSVCALAIGGRMYCWGGNFFGELGIGSFAITPSPVLAANGVRFSILAMGTVHTCGVSAGETYCWGANFAGQLGAGELTSIPVQTLTHVAAGPLQFTQLANQAAGNHTCALIADGSAYCWGANPLGELGIGSMPPGTPVGNPLPQPVLGGLRFARITVGGDHSCGLTPAGAAYCWGAGDWGALGTGSLVTSTTPVPVSGGITFKIQ